MSATQDHLTISDIKEDIVLLKSGGACIVLQTTAVNFDLLSETEQVSIIQSFAQMLNSLSFPIQIVIRSKRLDITNYLRRLDQAIYQQSNPLLATMITKYRQFVQSLIRQNEVLDKHFFIVIPLSNLELSIVPAKKEETFRKIKTVLAPKKEQITRQLGRVGIGALQLNTRALIELFYDIYNPLQELPLTNQNLEIKPAVFKPIQPAAKSPPAPQVPLSAPITNNQSPITNPRPSRAHPFVVEELMDTI